MFAHFTAPTGATRLATAKTLLASLIALAATLPAQLVEAQTHVLFETTVGDFEMILNPQGITEVEPAAERFRELVEADYFDNTIINRADPTGVVQFGTLDGNVSTLEEVLDPGFGGLGGFVGIPLPSDLTEVRFDDDLNNMVDFDFLGMGLSNVRGTVSYALAGGTINPTGGSVFVNTVDNPFMVDQQNFVPFAVVPDLTVIDAIQDLNQRILSTSPAFSNFPVVENVGGPTDLVLIERAVLLIPEPACATLALMGLGLAAGRRRLL